MSGLVIDPDLSFMQGVMLVAKAEGVIADRISGKSGVAVFALRPTRLNSTIFPNWGKMTITQAENTIRILRVGDVTERALRALKGYPVPFIDDVLAQQIAADTTQGLEILKGKTFGELYKCNREQKARGGSYLRQEDCVITETERGAATSLESAPAISVFESGKIRATQSQGFALLARLGYKANAQGLEKFCHETSSMLRKQNERMEKFGKSLFILLHPDGTITPGKRGGGFRSVTSAMVEDAAGVSPDRGWAYKIFYGETTLTEERIKRIVKIFGFTGADAEERFYRQAEKIKPLSQVRLPEKKKSPEAIIRFGKIIDVMRTELGVTQHELEAALRDRPVAEIKNANGITSIQNGTRTEPVDDAAQARIARALGCKSSEELRAVGMKVAQVQMLREGHLGECLEKVLEEHSRKPVSAVTLLRVIKRGDTVTPTRVRKVLQELGVREAELYGAKPKTCDEVVAFAAKFEQKQFHRENLKKDKPGQGVFL